MLLSRSAPPSPNRPAGVTPPPPRRLDRPALFGALVALAAAALTAGATIAALEDSAAAPSPDTGSVETATDVSIEVPAAAIASPRPEGSEGDDDRAPDGRPRVDVNGAGAEELMRIPGIGPAMARRILEFREEHGPFRDVDELLKVRGIGEKSLQKLRPWVRVADDG